MVDKRAFTRECFIAALTAVAMALFIASFSIYQAYAAESSQSVQPAMPETDLCSGHVTKKEYDMAIDECTKRIQSGKTDGSVYFNRGRAYLNKGDLDLAIADSTKAIEMNPGLAGAYYDRGFVYYNKGDLDLAIADYAKAIEMNPGLAGAYFERGLVYDKKGQYDLAIADYTKAIELNPESNAAFFNRGLAYYNKRQHDLAFADFNKAIEMNPKLAVSEHAQKYMARGRAAFESVRSDEDYAAVIAEFKKAVDSAPWLAQGYYNLGLAQEKAGQIDDAMRNFKLYLLAAPAAKDAQAVKNRIYGLEYKTEQSANARSMSDECNRLLKVGRIEEGIAACKEAVRLDPKYDLAHYNLGVALRDRFGVARRQEACPEAIPEFEEAIRLNGYDLNAYINAGLCYNNIRDYRKAINIIEEGIRKCTIDVFANYNRSTAFAYGQLGWSYASLGEYEKALNYYEKAKELGADDPGIDEDMNKLRHLLGR